MPRLQTFELVIETGARGCSSPPKYSINGFMLDFDETEGGCGPGETFRGVGMPDSFPHTLVLHGPREGVWDIASIRATYSPLGEEPYTVKFSAVSLDHETDLNIWHQRPAPTFDV